MCWCLMQRASSTSRRSVSPKDRSIIQESLIHCSENHCLLVYEFSGETLTWQISVVYFCRHRVGQNLHLFRMPSVMGSSLRRLRIYYLNNVRKSKLIAFCVVLCLVYILFFGPSLFGQKKHHGVVRYKVCEYFNLIISSKLLKDLSETTTVRGWVEMQTEVTDTARYIVLFVLVSRVYQDYRCFGWSRDTPRP